MRALTGIDDGRNSAFRRAAERLEKSTPGNSIAPRTAVETNTRLMESIADAIRDRGNENATYGVSA